MQLIPALLFALCATGTAGQDQLASLRQKVVAKRAQFQASYDAWFRRTQGRGRTAQDRADKDRLDTEREAVRAMIDEYNTKSRAYAKQSSPPQDGIREASASPAAGPIRPTRMTEGELAPYREAYEKIRSYTSWTFLCKGDDGRDVPNDSLKGYSDATVVEETRDPDHWECELAQSGGVFHTALNHCHQQLQGQCVEWADGRYFMLTGFHGFAANAGNWTFMAHLSDEWEVYDTPVYPAIAVDGPGINGAGSSGHVAVVESISDGKVCTSHWNAPAQKKLTTILRAPAIGTKYLRHVKAPLHA